MQDNILFDLEWSPGRYESALLAADLYPDLEQLAAGDQTELGEGVRSLTRCLSRCSRCTQTHTAVPLVFG